MKSSRGRPDKDEIKTKSTQGGQNTDEIKTKSTQGRPNKDEITSEKLVQHDNGTFHENTRNACVHVPQQDSTEKNKI